jgi:ABC-type Fe3+-hydroxamate transport system substrate-binding protein
MLDDLGHECDGPRPATRVVSLVPSLTEALASVSRERLVGATDWCTHPADLEVARVRGTKNPDLPAIRALQPDVVVANREENRELDVRRLREAGTRVWVTDIQDVPQAVGSLERLFDALGWVAPAWLEQARLRWCGPLPPITRSVAIAVWRDPWMVVGTSTFTGDLVRRMGWRNVYDRPEINPENERYPKVSLDDLDAAGADVVLLPDEPYPFTASDGPEAFTATPTELVSGRLITWYGPSLTSPRLEARAQMSRSP